MTSSSYFRATRFYIFNLRQESSFVDKNIDKKIIILYNNIIYFSRRDFYYDENEKAFYNGIDLFNNKL